MSLRSFYGHHARALPLPTRAGLCIALGEAAELEGRLEVARYLYASAVTAIDPTRDERLYARAALRALLNASLLGDREVLRGVARLVEKLPEREMTSRLACLGAAARGLERFLKEDWTGARRAFEAAMGAAWETRDADAEALAHHLLAQAWSRLGRLARANEHVDAAGSAAIRSGSSVLQLRMTLEQHLSQLGARATPERLNRMRRYLADLRKRGFPRLESMAWSRLALRIPAGRRASDAFLSRSEKLLPSGHPDRAFLKRARATLRKHAPDGAPGDPRIRRELAALTRMAGGKG